MTSLRFAEDESLSLRCNLWNRSRRSSCDLDAASGADADAAGRDGSAAVSGGVDVGCAECVFDVPAGADPRASGV